MTVREVIEALYHFPDDANVYVPGLDAKAEIAKTVSGLVHTNIPSGISIPNDVCILPWTDDEFENLQQPGPQP